jgi:hypothetical protein
MTATQTTQEFHPTDSRRRPFRELRLNPRTHGRGRVPGRRAAAFDLETFSHALADRDLDYQLSRYAADADIRIVDPDNPPNDPHLVQGIAAVRRWLWDSDAKQLDLQVTHAVDGGDRVAFTERWYDRDGTAVLATSTAELADGLITVQHTILLWGGNSGLADWLGPASRARLSSPLQPCA